MKLTFVFILITASFSLLCQTKFKYPKSESMLLSKTTNFKAYNDHKALRILDEIKYYILQGDLGQAKLKLIQAKYESGFSKPIQLRYLAIIEFLNGKYKKSSEILSNNIFQSPKYFKKVCLLQTLNFVMIDNKNEAKNNWRRCESLTYHDSENNQSWMHTLVALTGNYFTKDKINFFKNKSIRASSLDNLKLYLKLALYLDEYNYVLKKIETLDYLALEDPQIRELIGIMFYRASNFSKAMQYFANLETPNINNIKASFYQADKKYELAYAAYKVALKSKDDSKLALTNLIPLSWKLRQWNEGLKYTLQHDKRENLKYKHLQAAYLSQKEDYEKSNKILRYIMRKKNNTVSKQINTIISYNYLKLKDNKKAAKYISRSCELSDGMSCMFQFHFSSWDNFAQQTTKSDQSIIRSNLYKRYIAGLNNDKLDEHSYIEQKHIEKLDLKESF
ncbi:MAG: hypothetical protein N4A33_01135 [Bacteriovoracaceae bacterium]|jgi:hypothetical protein|nr:hypothetical protein [Bacteriovoracaceae bacterium]